MSSSHNKPYHHLNSHHSHHSNHNHQSSSSSSSRHVNHQSFTASSSSSTTLPHHQAAHRASSSKYWDTVLDPTPVMDMPRRHSDAPSRTIAKPSPRECPTCHRSLSSTRAFEEHLRQCSPQIEKPYVCEECGTAFKKNSNLVKHMKLVHLGERNFACPESGCGRLFGQKSNLNSHIKAVHLGEKPFVCSEADCGRRFSQKSGLKAHIKTVHNGERPYVCDCGSSFGHRGDLNRHIRVLHERQRPFECPMCPEPRAFGRKSVLMRHMLTHTQGTGGVASSRSDSS